MNSENKIQLAENFAKDYELLKNEIGKVIVGQEAAVNLILTSIFTRSHSLLIGVPGLAKTLLVNTVAKALGLKFNRIQFTPDLMPSDIVGAEILNKEKQFEFIKGPVFANILLADEINRTPPKTQAALLEAMQERKVTAAGHTYDLPNPFFVLATQNPIEQEGTYPLPEAQLDRFMFNIWVDYPSFDEELELVKRTTAGVQSDVNRVITQERLMEYQELIRSLPVADNVFHYAVNLVSSTRPQRKETHDYVNEYISWGAGPRASQNLILAAKAHAMSQGKFAPDVEDVKAIANAVLRHRLVPNYKAEAEAISVDKIIEKIL